MHLKQKTITIHKPSKIKRNIVTWGNTHHYLIVLRGVTSRLEDAPA